METEAQNSISWNVSTEESILAASFVFVFFIHENSSRLHEKALKHFWIFPLVLPRRKQFSLELFLYRDSWLHKLHKLVEVIQSELSCFEWRDFHLTHDTKSRLEASKVCVWLLSQISKYLFPHIVSRIVKLFFNRSVLQVSLEMIKFNESKVGTQLL